MKRPYTFFHLYLLYFENYEYIKSSLVFEGRKGEKYWHYSLLKCVVCTNIGYKSLVCYNDMWSLVNWGGGGVVVIFLSKLQKMLRHSFKGKVLGFSLIESTLLDLKRTLKLFL